MFYRHGQCHASRGALCAGVLYIIIRTIAVFVIPALRALMARLVLRVLRTTLVLHALLVLCVLLARIDVIVPRCST